MDSATPPRVLRTRHTPTPKMSERKKSLFAAASGANRTPTTPSTAKAQRQPALPVTLEEDSDIGPMSPLQFSCSPLVYDAHPTNADRSDFRAIMQQLSPRRAADHYELLAPAGTPSVRERRHTISASSTAVRRLPTSLDRDAGKENTCTPAGDPLKPANRQKTPTALPTAKPPADGVPFGRALRTRTISTDRSPAELPTPAVNGDSAGQSLRGADKPTIGGGISTRSFYGSPAVAPPFTAARKTAPPKIAAPPARIMQRRKSMSAATFGRSSAATSPPANPTSAGGIHRKRVLRPSSTLLGFNRGCVGHRIARPKLAQAGAAPAVIAHHPGGGRRFSSRAEVIAAALELIESHAKVTRAILNNSIRETNAVPEACEDTQISQAQIDKLQRILRNQRNALEIGSKQLNWLGGASASGGAAEMDATFGSDVDNTFGHLSVLDGTLLNASAAGQAPAEAAPADVPVADAAPAAKRKFFKSDTANAHQYTVMRGVCASVKRGAGVQLVSPPKPKKPKHSQREYAELRAIQQEITDIIGMLEDSTPGAVILAEKRRTVVREEPSAPPTATSQTSPDTLKPAETPAPFALRVQSQDEADRNYRHYAAMLPFGSADAALQERQRTLLNVLHTNRICDEHTFRIFIGEPQAHEAQAARILDELYQVTVVGDSEHMEPLVMPTDECAAAANRVDRPDSPASQISSLTSAMGLGSPTPVPMVGQPALFPIFDRDNRPADAPATGIGAERPSPATRLIDWKAYGRDARQLQIDAGQKRFGGRTCAECGMFYAQHEPEEEALHRRFHDDTVRLNFKGWTDERVICEVPEWGRDGRIVCVLAGDAKAKRNRTAEIVRLVDESLGAADAAEPIDDSAVYLAIARRQVVGLCVADTLKRAHPMSIRNGIPMMHITQKVPVRCGLSRLWVCEAYRRHGIATRLFHAMFGHFGGAGTTSGAPLALADVAFCSPTEIGCMFASKLMGPDNIVVY